MINLLLTECEGCTGEYWPEEQKMTESQYSLVQLEQARLESSLLYGTWAMLVVNLPALENEKYTVYVAKSWSRKYQSECWISLKTSMPYNK